MGIFRRSSRGAVGQHTDAPEDPDTLRALEQGRAARGWVDINAVRAEWPEEQLDKAADLAAWQEGIRVYDNDDYASMMRCASLLSRALAHSLYGDGLIQGDDLPETVHKVIYSSLCAPPDGQTFAESAQQAARLALTIVRENGWIPARLGGLGLFDPMIQNAGNSFLLAAAIASPGEIAGDLDQFFLVPPTPLVDATTASQRPADAGGREGANRSEESREEAAAFAAGFQFHLEGRNEEALAAFEQAARFGWAEAMNAACEIARELGRDADAHRWLENAAHAGSNVAMFDMGVIALQAGDAADARSWFEKAAYAGNTEGFAALTQTASDNGDAAAERRWAELGAEAGNPFCMTRHAVFIIVDGPSGDIATARRAAPLLEAAASAGNTDAMALAVGVFDDLGQIDQSRKWLAAARASGDQSAIALLQKHGY